jgi:RNA polymerase primary sigma factor
MIRRINQSSRGGFERSLECYLREIGRYPLLTRQEECELAARIREGDDDALHDLVRGNLRFVVTIAKQYLGQGLSLEDLINEGNIGLMKAGRRFDERRGFKFISYAVWWVRQAILQAIADQSRTVRLPQNRTVVLHRVHRTFARLQQEQGRAPTAEEVAEVAELKLEEVREALRIGQPEMYLDEVLSDDDGRTMGDALADDTESARADAGVMARTRTEALERALDTLPEREAEILRLYYGLGQPHSLTLEEIGGRFGLTRERIRQLKERALGRLREQEGSDALMDHYRES